MCHLSFKLTRPLHQLSTRLILTLLSTAHYFRKHVNIKFSKKEKKTHINMHDKYTCMSQHLVLQTNKVCDLISQVYPSEDSKWTGQEYLGYQQRLEDMFVL